VGGAGGGGVGVLVGESGGRGRAQEIRPRNRKSLKNRPIDPRTSSIASTAAEITFRVFQNGEWPTWCNRPAVGYEGESAGPVTVWLQRMHTGETSSTKRPVRSHVSEARRQGGCKRFALHARSQRCARAYDTPAVCGRGEKKHLRSHAPLTKLEQLPITRPIQGWGAGRQPAKRSCLMLAPVSRHIA